MTECRQRLARRLESPFRHPSTFLDNFWGPFDDCSYLFLNTFCGKSLQGLGFDSHRFHRLNILLLAILATSWLKVWHRHIWPKICCIKGKQCVQISVVIRQEILHIWLKDCHLARHFIHPQWIYT